MAAGVRNRFGKDDEKKKVFIKTNFLKLSEINTIREEFLADVQIQARWREPALDNTQENAEVDFSNYWNPMISINNTKPGAKVHITTTLCHYSNGETYVVERRRIKGMFSESLELQTFPFDIQDLTVVVSSEHPHDVLDIVEDEEELSAVNIDCFVKDTEWTVMDLVYTEPLNTRSCMSRDFIDIMFKNPGLSAKCVAKRRAGFYLYNIILIMVLITSLAFATFAVDLTYTADRIQLSFVILLTGVTFKAVTNRSLPKIPYLTHLDHYIISSMVFNWLICVWHAIVWKFKNSIRKDLDFWALIISAAIYVIFHLLFFTIVLLKAKAIRLGCARDNKTNRTSGKWLA